MTVNAKKIAFQVGKGNFSLYITLSLSEINVYEIQKSWVIGGYRFEA